MRRRQCLGTRPDGARGALRVRPAALDHAVHGDRHSARAGRPFGADDQRQPARGLRPGGQLEPPAHPRTARRAVRDHGQLQELLHRLSRPLDLVGGRGQHPRHARGGRYRHPPRRGPRPRQQELLRGVGRQRPAGRSGLRGCTARLLAPAAARLVPVASRAWCPSGTRTAIRPTITTSFCSRRTARSPATPEDRASAPGSRPPPRSRRGHCGSTGPR